MLEAPAQLLCGFVLEKSAEVAAPQRARLYRALAAVIGNPDETAKLNTLAAALEAIDEQHRQLVLDFKRRAG